MRDFAEQLSDARKAKGYTQEQLAEYLNVSRTNVSRWENGRTIPDLETVKLLSKILDCDFFAGGTLTDEQNAPGELPEPEKDTASEENAQDERPEPEKDTAGEENAQAELPEPEMHSAPERPAPRGRKRILLAALGAVLLCAVVVVCQMMNGKPSGAQAQVSIVPMENPVHAIHCEDYPDGVGWLYEFRIEETAGVPFTVHQLDSIIINDNGGEDTHSFTGEDVAQWWGSDTLVQNSHRASVVGFPCRM